MTTALAALSAMDWSAVILVGAGAALLATGLLSRVYEREKGLAEILDLPYGERDVDMVQVTQHSSLVENTIGFAARLVEQVDERGSTLKKLEAARIPMKPGEYVLLVGVAGLLMGLAVAAITTNLVFGIVVFLASPLAGKAFLDYRVRARIKQFEEQFPEALTLIASSLSAGHTFLRSIQMMTQEASGPIAEEFGRVVAETQLGDPLVDALDRMAERLELRDVEWVVQAIKIQQTVGGKLADLLHTLADFIRAREEIRREIDVLTAEGRLSAYVLGGLPVFLAFVIQTLNPGYLDPMFRGWGWFWLGLSAAITVGAIYIIMRMVKSVEV